MLAYIPYMDPLGYKWLLMEVFSWENHLEPSLSLRQREIVHCHLWLLEGKTNKNSNDGIPNNVVILR